MNPSNLRKKEFNEQKFYGQPTYYIHQAFVKSIESMSGEFASAQKMEDKIVIFDFYTGMIESLCWAAGIFSEETWKDYVGAIKKKSDELSEKTHFQNNPSDLLLSVARFKWKLLAKEFFSGTIADQDLDA